MFYPLPPQWLEDLSQSLLGWPASTVEFLHWCTLLIFGTLVTYYRYDFLGMISGLVKSLVKPGSLKESVRTLDQQISVFIFSLGIIFFGVRFGFDVIRMHAIDATSSYSKINFILDHPGFKIFTSFLSGLLLYLGLSLNKRLRGLNQIRWVDIAKIGALALIAALPGSSLLAVLYFAFFATHHHYETTLKYSHMILTLVLGFQLIIAHPGSSIPRIEDCIQYMGVMNLVVVSILTIFFTWIILDSLPKAFQEKHVRLFIWLTPLLSLGYIGVMLWK